MYRFLTALLFVALFFTLHAGEPMLWDVAVDRDDSELKDAFGALDVWSAYRGGDGLWHYRVAASEGELSQLRLFKVRVVPLMPLSRVTPPPASEYRDADTVNATLLALEENYPGRAKLYTIGQTFEGRDIVAIKISADPSQNVAGKTEVLFTGMHHAREWIGVEVPLRLAEFLLEQYDQNDRIKQIVDACELWIVPMLNQDGYRFSWTDERLWRKTRRLNSDNSYGVDPNRNYDAGWGGKGSSKTPSNEVYCGTAPFSEPETAAVRNLVGGTDVTPMNGWIDDIAGFIDFHSYSQLVLYPYGNTYTASPREKEMSAIATKMSDIIQAETGMYYEPMKSSALYIATGGSSDWFHLAHDFKNTMTVEMRPTGNDPNGFTLDPAQIKETARENIAAALYFVEATMYATTEVDTDVNGNGVVDYLEGCGTALCDMLYDERSDDEPVTDDGEVVSDETVLPDAGENDIKDDDENVADNEGAFTADTDEAAVTVDTDSNIIITDDEQATDTDTTPPRRAASSGGCSVLFL